VGTASTPPALPSNSNWSSGASRGGPLPVSAGPDGGRGLQTGGRIPEKRLLMMITFSSGRWTLLRLFRPRDKVDGGGERAEFGDGRDDDRLPRSSGCDALRWARWTRYPPKHAILIRCCINAGPWEMKSVSSWTPDEGAHAQHDQSSFPQEPQTQDADDHGSSRRTE